MLCSLSCSFSFSWERAAILGVAAFILLQVTVFKVQYPVKAVVEQIPAVGDHQQCALVAVNQLTQPIEIAEIQKDVGLVHNQQVLGQQHLPRMI